MFLCRLQTGGRVGEGRRRQGDFLPLGRPGQGRQAARQQLGLRGLSVLLTWHFSIHSYIFVKWCGFRYAWIWEYRKNQQFEGSHLKSSFKWNIIFDLVSYIGFLRVFMTAVRHISNLLMTFITSTASAWSTAATGWTRDARRGSANLSVNGRGDALLALSGDELCLWRWSCTA